MQDAVLADDGVLSGEFWSAVEGLLVRQIRYLNETMIIEVTDGASRLTLDVIKRVYPDADYWSRNYVEVLVGAKLPGFQASFTGEMHLMELGYLASDVQRLYSELSGTAKFEASEGFLTLIAEVSSRGHILWEVSLMNLSGMDTTANLSFRIEADQSYLPKLLNQIEAVQKDFPLA